jgi:type IV pilus biogenesis protein PilP
MQNKYAVCAAALALLFSGSACADDGKTSGTVSEIMRLNDEIQGLQLELKRVDLQAQIAAKKAETAPRSAAPLPTSGPSSLPPPLPGGADGRGFGAMPMVTGLEGVDGKLRATLAMSGEGSVIVAEGDVLPGGWRVEHITEASVIVRKDKERRSLPFGREAVPGLSRTGAGAPAGY